MWTTPDTEDTWRVVTARRYREAVARVRLAEQGPDTYLPLLRRWPRPPAGSDVGPLFPGYVFVRAERAHFHRITRTPGVGGLIERRVSARERVLVLLDILQRQTRVEMSETWLRLD